MGWTYDPTISVPRDQVRLLIGDTDTTDQQLSDEEIAWMLGQCGNNATRAAIAACDALAAKYVRRSAQESQSGDDRVRFGDLASSYRALATQLRATGGITGAARPRPFAGGISVADKDTRESDTDRVTPFFRRVVPTSEGPNADDE